MSKRSDLRNRRTNLSNRKKDLIDCRTELLKLYKTLSDRRDPGGLGLDETFYMLAGEDVDKLYTNCHWYYNDFHKHLYSVIDSNVVFVTAVIDSLTLEISNLNSEIMSSSEVV